ncbi:MAG: metallophosphoesterase [Gammaproteobacteria bacterium]
MSKFNIQKRVSRAPIPRKYCNNDPNLGDIRVVLDDRYSGKLPEERPYGRIRIQLKPIYAILLHPSFGAPALASSDSGLSLYYLIHDNLKVSYEHMHDDDPISTEDNAIFLKRLMLQTGIAPWDNVVKHPGEHKIISHLSKSWMFEDDFPGKITCTAPLKVEVEKGLLLKNAEDLIIARIEPLILKYYNDLGYRHWVRLDIEKHNLSPGLYNITWNSLHPERYADASNAMLHHPQSVCQIFYEPQDDILMSALKNSGSEKTRSFYIPGEGDFEYQWGDAKIESLHPVYISDAPILNTGHVSDIHISSQQHFFKKASKLQVLPGVDPADSPYIGDLMNHCFENIKSILDQMGKNPDIHVLLITGDLVDYTKSLDPTKTGIKRMGELWRGALSDEKHFEKGIDTLVMYSLVRYFYDTYQKPVFMVIGNHDAYVEPFGISPRCMEKNRVYKGVYEAGLLVDRETLSQELLDKVEKVFDDEANGGFSRIKLEQPEKVAMKANEAIPCDHNLTFMESLLLYGPNFGTILKSFNFTYEQTIFFYTLFTPASDFTVSYKNQVFTGLNWGEAEDFTMGAFTSAGSLPRADKSFTAAQMALLEDAKKWKLQLNVKYQILFMHATFVNYAQKIPLADEGVIEHVRPWYILRNGTAYDQGSMTDKRHHFGETFIRAESQGLTHMYSGHSHRAGVYRVSMPPPYSAGQDLGKGIDYYLHPYNYKLVDTVTIKTRGHYTGYYRSELWGNSPMDFVVSASAGPVAIRNIRNEFCGLGLDLPSGTISYYASQANSDKTKYELVTSKKKQAKPRMCVLFDFFVVHKLGSAYSGSFNPKIDNVMFLDIEEKVSKFFNTPDWCSQVKMYFIDFETNDARKESQKINVFSSGKSKVGFKFSEIKEFIRGVFNENNYNKEKIGKTQFFYLLFYFNHKQITNANSYIADHYDYSNPWISVVDISSDEQIKLKHNIVRQEFPLFQAYLERVDKMSI